MKSNISSEYSIDGSKSCVLEFTPGGIYPYSSRVLNRGRFYYSTSYFVSNGESVAKSTEFQSWVDKIYKLFKKELRLERIDKSPVFLSAGTIEWMKRTGAIVDAPLLKVSY